MSFVDPEVYANHTFSEDEIKKKFRDPKLKPAPIVRYKGKNITVVDFFKSYSSAPIKPEKKNYWTKQRRR